VYTQQIGHTRPFAMGVKLKLQVPECTQHKTDLRFISSKHPVAIVEVRVPSAVPSTYRACCFTSHRLSLACVAAAVRAAIGGLVWRRVRSKSAAPLAFLFHSYQMEKSSSMSCCPSAGAVAHTDACIDFSSQPASKHSFVVSIPKCPNKD
jgi:hypothetical protein